MLNANPGDIGLLRSPREIVFGPGALAALPRVVTDFGSRAFICVDPFVAGTTNFTDLVRALERAGVTVTAFAEIAPELPLTVVEAAVRASRAAAPDVLIGFGGGSAIDLAKLVAVGMTARGPISNYYGENLVPSGIAPIIAIPTTSGTGSEVTPVAVLADPDRELKVGISSPWLIPQVALVDPVLTYTCPASVTAFSGIDALTHAIEAYSSHPRTLDPTVTLPVFVGANTISDNLALNAISAIGPHLVRAVRSPLDVEARAAMSYGSLMAGLAFGVGGTHLSHALQYPIGGETKTPHGLGVGLLLPYVMEACLSGSTADFADVGRALGVPGDETADLAANAIRAVAALRIDIGVPHTLAEVGISAADLPRIADLASQVGRLLDNAPVSRPRDLIMPILQHALVGRSDLFDNSPSTGATP